MKVITNIMNYMYMLTNLPLILQLLRFQTFKISGMQFHTSRNAFSAIFCVDVTNRLLAIFF